MSLQLTLSIGQGFYLIYENKKIKVSLLRIEDTSSKFNIDTDNLKNSLKRKDISVDYTYRYHLEELPETTFAPYKNKHTTSRQIKVSINAPREVRIWHSRLEKKFDILKKE